MTTRDKLKKGDLLREHYHNCVRYLGKKEAKHYFQIYDSTRVLAVEDENLSTFLSVFEHINQREWQLTSVAQHCWYHKTKFKQTLGTVADYKSMYTLIKAVQHQSFSDLIWELIKRTKSETLIKALERHKSNVHKLKVTKRYTDTPSPLIENIDNFKTLKE